jgi:hypothetical protein
MKIVGCDFRPGHQQISMDTVTGEVGELKLGHGDGEAERFYRELESPAGVRLYGMLRIRRLFATRAARVILWPARARSFSSMGTLASRAGGMFITAIMVAVRGRIDGWWNACFTASDWQRGLA